MYQKSNMKSMDVMLTQKYFMRNNVSDCLIKQRKFYHFDLYRFINSFGFLNRQLKPSNKSKHKKICY